MHTSLTQRTMLGLLPFWASSALLFAAPATDPEISSLQTFGTMGKEVTPLSTNREAELFRHTASRLPEIRNVKTCASGSPRT
jgi:hypothetical protein